MQTKQQNPAPSFSFNRRAKRGRTRPLWGLGTAQLLLLFSLGFNQTHAACDNCGTSVSGYVIDTTWTAAKSPYCVTGDVYVLGGVTIEAGVTVQFCDNYEFEVGGILRVAGSSNSPVLFTAGTTNGWKGILFRDAVPGSFFNYAIIEGANQSGVRITNTPPAFTNCIIRNNSSPDFGGGLLAGIPSNQKLSMQNCILSNNLANPIYGSGHGYGGGLYVNGSMLLDQCTIVSNWTHGYYGYGGGIFSVDGDCTLRNCTISGNMVDATYRDDAAGVYFDDATFTKTLQMNNCTVAANGLPGAAAQFSGGGILAYRGIIKLANCLVVSNLHEGIYVQGAQGSIVNCTVAYNDAGHWGIASAGGAIGVTNCIVYHQYGANVWNADVAYSDVQGGVQPGPGNISFAPGLRPGTFELLTGSPCIDAGHPDTAFSDVCFPPSRGLLRNDMGAFGGPGACGWGTDPNAPKIIARPEPQWGCPSSRVAFSVAATTNAGPLRYQWFRNTSAIAGQRGAVLSLTGLTTNAAGPYSVMVSNDYAGFSATAVLSMYEACVDLSLNGTNRSVTISPAGTYVLKYTTNGADADFETWTPLATNTFTGSNWVFFDTNSPAAQMMFYGVKRLP